MIALIKAALMALYSILPSSPIKMITESTAFDGTFLSYLNWFVPFDICSTITLSWIGCILAYYTFKLVKEMILDKLIDILMNII